MNTKERIEVHELIYQGYHPEEIIDIMGFNDEEDQDEVYNLYDDAMNRDYIDNFPGQLPKGKWDDDY